MRIPLICDDCALCCMHAGTPPFVDGEVPSDLPDEARAKLQATADEVCTWLKDKRCQWYEFRPKACRDFIIEGHDCLKLRESTNVCHGL